MYLPLLRRLFLFAAVVCLISFSLLLIHSIHEGLPISWKLVAGAVTALLVVLLSWIAMAKTDDYLTPAHNRIFLAATVALTAPSALALFLFFQYSRDFPATYLYYFGVAPAVLAIGHIVVSVIKMREAYGLPPNYRSEANPWLFGLLPAGASLPILLVSAGLLGLSIKEVRHESRFDDTVAEVPPRPPLSPVDREAAANELFQLGLKEKDEERYRRSFELFQQASLYGHPGANYEIALFHAGNGFLRNLPSAYEYFRKAASQGHLEATFRLGKMYRHGELGTEVDSIQAREYLTLAAEAGHLQAQTQLGHLYNRGEGVAANPEQAFYWFHRAALQGDPVAQNDVGIFYLQGVGVEANQEEGLRWVSQAAESGLTVAEYNLARALHVGELLPRDYLRAFEYFQRLANKNIPYGFYMMGQQYLNGHGVEQDHAAAFSAFSEGAARRDPASKYYLALCYLNGLGVEAYSTAGLAYLESSASLGYAEAQFLLGEIHLAGKIILQDRAEAAALFRTAAAQGLEKAINSLEELEPILTSEEMSLADQRLSVWQNTP
jgi:TPR repeat protein